MADLREYLNYDPASGVFTWKKRAHARMAHNKVGMRAGLLGSSGYRYIKFGQKLYREHRLAFEFIYGVRPKEVDHINGDRADNRIANLRAATHQQNLANCKNRKNNTSGKKGVHKHKDGRWRARISVDGKSIHLGLFTSLDEAHAAYVGAAERYFGEFARAA